MTDKEKDLEQEVKRCVYDAFFDLDGVAVKGATQYLTVEDVADIARHFAAWQRGQMLRERCMYAKDHYTAEDRAVLCDGCEEDCKFNNKED